MRTFTNQEIAKLLRQVAAAYEVKDGQMFRVAAYRNASAAIEHSTADIKDIWDERKLEEIPGVGKAIASYLDELFRIGQVRHFEKLMAKLPAAMFVFMDIPGIGPKTAYKLAKELKIESASKAIEKLKKAARKGKIAEIEGFGAKSQQDIIEAIQALKKGQTGEKRMTLPYADGLAQKIISYLKENKAVLRANPLGSLRRMAATIGDIDISVATKKPEEAIEWFVKYPDSQKLIEKGISGASILLKNGRQVDLRVASPDSYGAMLQYFTGSKQHNIKLREYALKMGLSLSEYGMKIVDRVNKAQSAKLKMQNYSVKRKTYEFREEKKFYEALGMGWIAPEMREDTGEIEASQAGRLPLLVEAKDVKGDFHLHSNFPIEESHDPGMDSIEQIIEVAKSLNYEYIGFSEHNPSQSRHSEGQIMDLIKKKKERIEQINYSASKEVAQCPYLFNGLEVDVRPNGELALPEKAFDYLDYIIVSVHSEFQLERKKMTERVLRALDYPKVKIFGHPTGRKLGQREGYELDWEKILEICKKRNVWLEINAFPDRLDLPDFLVREAVKNGVKIIINTDSHSAEQMTLIPYGVSVARRGWAEKKDIINTLGCARMKEEILKKGGEKKCG